MSRKNKFFHPYARVNKISSYEEAEKLSVDYTRLKQLALRPNGVKFWIVSGLSDSSYMDECFTNKNIVDMFVPSDIGEQIGFVYANGGQDRRFINDIGLGTSKYNRHLVFLSEHIAKKYVEYQKTSGEEKMRRDEFLNELDMWDTFVESEMPDTFFDDVMFGE